MQLVDDMKVVFRNEAHRRRFKVLAQRERALSIYPDGLIMTTLGIRDIVMYLLNQIGWEKFAVRKRFSPYRRLTLEFLSSLYYDPNKGFGFGRGWLPLDFLGPNIVSPTMRWITF